MDFIIGDQPHSNLAFHFTKAENLAKILYSGNMRLGSYEGTNDPRENKNWRPLIQGESESSEEDIFYYDAVLRKSAKVGCFSNDGSGGVALKDDRQNYLSRGWAKPRMWTQYGGNHSGACLVFDKGEFFDKVHRSIGMSQPVERFPFLYMRGDVVYNDDPPSRIEINPSQESEVRVERVIGERENDLKGRFFKKYSDWESEQEFRIVVLTNPKERYLDVPFGDSLKAIVLGESYPEEDMAVIRHRLRAVNLKEMPVYQCSWETLLPSVDPLKSSYLARTL